MTPTTSADASPSQAGDLLVREVSVGGMDNRAYLLSAPPDDAHPRGTHVLVDAAAEPAVLLDLLAAAGADPGDLAAVVTTHRHPDHVAALVEVLASTGAEHLAGTDDADHLPAPVTRALDDGDVVQIGSVGVTVIALRGHTPGSVALLVPAPTEAGPSRGPAHLFTGDSLFPGGPGRTPDPEAFASLMDDLETRVFGVLGDDVIVHPGHGEGTTLGTERPALPAWRARGW